MHTYLCAWICECIPARLDLPSLCRWHRNARHLARSNWWWGYVFAYLHETQECAFTETKPKHLGLEFHYNIWYRSEERQNKLGMSSISWTPPNIQVSWIRDSLLATKFSAITGTLLGHKEKQKQLPRQRQEKKLLWQSFGEEATKSRFCPMRKDFAQVSLELILFRRWFTVALRGQMGTSGGLGYLPAHYYDEWW